MRRIGIDIGGHGVRGAVVGEGDALDVRTVALPRRDEEVVLDAVEAIVRELGGADQVGIGVPGFVRHGVVLGSPNFPTWKNVRLRDQLEARLRARVAVHNDASAAAWGIWRARGGAEELVALTLGTGVGGGAVVGGRLLEGRDGMACEFGHLRVGGNRLCGCGARGCLETWVGTHGLIGAAKERGVEVAEGRAVIDAARRREGWAMTVVADAADALGRVLATLVNVFNPDVIALAGGLSGASDVLRTGVEDGMRSHAVQAAVDSVDLVWVGRADAFAIRGAADLAGA